MRNTLANLVAITVLAVPAMAENLSVVGSWSSLPLHNQYEVPFWNKTQTDPEVLETRFPVRVEEFSIRQISSGAGAYRGGDGIVRRLRFLEPMTVTVLSSHREVPPQGAAGGGPGKLGENSVIRQNGDVLMLRGNDETQVESGDVFVLKTPGGGGFGHVR